MWERQGIEWPAEIEKTYAVVDDEDDEPRTGGTIWHGTLVRWGHGAKLRSGIQESSKKDGLGFHGKCCNRKLYSVIPP